MACEAQCLTSLAVIRIAGPDAISFLQGQVSNDVTLLADGRTQLAAYSTPQGRVIALLRLRQQGGDIYALLPAELAESVVGRLRRFVLRAKVELTLGGDWQVAWPEDPAGRDAVGDATGLSFTYPDGRRLVARHSVTDGAAAALADPRTAELDQRWLAADIAAGLPQVTAATSGHFVPQMLNLDLIDAISFAKGCYTGQEIVARTQNLGRIKRRCFRYAVAADTPPEPLIALHRDGVKVGEVVISAPVGNAAELLAVVSLDARDLPLRTATGQTVVPLPLPYSVPEH